MKRVFERAIAALDPAAAVRRVLPDFEGRRVRAFAIGKAAAAMARGVSLPVLCPPGGHPIPDERSVAAAQALLALADSVTADETMLALISGGASAMACAPLGVTLAEKIARVGEAMRAGAPIAELNALRTSVSAIKGGKLAARCRGRVVTIVLSDVVGDDPAIVGSGPTVPCDQVVVAAGVADLARAGARAAEEVLGVPARVVDGAVTGDVEDFAERIVRAIEGQTAPCALVWAGEPTITLPEAHGQGGRARHVALLVARAISTWGFRLLAAGSDGIDGTADAAGAIVDGETWEQVADGERAIATCDSGTALAPFALVTGPTGVNHADLYVVAIT